MTSGVPKKKSKRSKQNKRSSTKRQKKAPTASTLEAVVQQHRADAAEEKQGIGAEVVSQSLMSRNVDAGKTIAGKIFSAEATQLTTILKSFAAPPTKEEDSKGRLKAYVFPGGVRVDSKEGIEAVKAELNNKANLYKDCSESSSQEIKTMVAEIDASPDINLFRLYQKTFAPNDQGSVLDHLRYRDARENMLTASPHQRLVMWKEEIEKISEETESVLKMKLDGRENAKKAAATAKTVAERMILPPSEDYAKAREEYLRVNNIPEDSLAETVAHTVDLDSYFGWLVTFKVVSRFALLRGSAQTPIVPDNEVMAVFPAILVGVFLEHGPDSKIYRTLASSPTADNARTAVNMLSGISTYINVLRTLSDPKAIARSLQEMMAEIPIDDRAKLEQNVQHMLRRSSPAEMKKHIAAIETLSGELKTRIRKAEAVSSTSIERQKYLCSTTKDFGLFPKLQNSLLKLKIKHEEVQNLKEKQLFFAAAANSNALESLDFSEGVLKGMKDFEIKKFVGTTTRLMNIAAKGSGDATLLGIKEIYANRDKLMRFKGLTEVEQKKFLYMAEANTKVMTDVTKDSFARILRKEDASMQYNAGRDVSSGLLSAAKSAATVALKFFPTNVVLNVTNATRNAMDDVLSGSVPNPRKASANVASSVVDKTDNLRKLFVEGLDTEADAFGVFRRTHRNLANCHFVDLSTLGDRNEVASRVAEDTTGESFRIVAIPALAKSLKEGAQTLQEQLNNPQNFGWTETMSYACVDVLLLLGKLHVEYLSTSKHWRADEVNEKDIEYAQEEGEGEDEDEDEEKTQLSAEDPLLDIYFDIDHGSLQAMKHFRDKISGEDEDFMLPNPLFNRVEHAELPQNFYKSDLLYIIEWGLSYLKLEEYKRLHELTLTDEDLAQLARLGRQMGYNESFDKSSFSFINNIAGTKMFGSALLGLGVGLMSGAPVGRRVASAVATSVAARVGAQLGMFNPKHALIGAMVARVIESLSCIRSINGVFSHASSAAEVHKPLAWTLLTHEIYTSGLISFASALQKIVLDLIALSPLNGTQDTTQVLIRGILELVDNVLGYVSLDGVAKNVFNLVYNSFRLITPGTTRVLIESSHDNLQLSLKSYAASCISLIGVSAASVFPVMSVMSFASSSFLQGYVTAASGAQKLKDYLFKSLLPTFVRVFGSEVVDSLKRRNVLSATVSATVLIAMGTEVAFQIADRNKNTYNYLSRADPGPAALDQVQIRKNNWANFQKEHGGLVEVLSSINPFSHLFRFVTSPSIVDGTLMFLLEQLNLGCAKVSNQVHAAGCRKAVDTLSRIKTAQVTLGAIANLAPQIRSFLPPSYNQNLYFGNKLRNESCDFLNIKNYRGVSKLDTFTDVANPDKETSALITSVAPNVHKFLDRNPPASAVDSKDASLWTTRDLAENQTWDALLNSNPWVYKTLFQSDKKYNLFQLLILGTLNKGIVKQSPADQILGIERQGGRF